MLEALNVQVSKIVLRNNYMGREQFLEGGLIYKIFVGMEVTSFFHAAGTIQNGWVILFTYHM